MQRYRFYANNRYFRELRKEDDGDVVLYSDASSALTASEARVKELEKALTTMADTYAHFQNCYREVGFGDPLTERALMLCLKAEIKSREALGDVTATKGEAK